jgi:transposase-like protein
LTNPLSSGIFEGGRNMENLVVGGGRVALNERKARELLEKVRWPEGPICPHCVVVGGHYRVMPRKGSRNPVREGVWKCRDCRKQFTVTVGTVFQGSKIPLSKWVTAIHLMGDSARGVNAHQLHKRLGLTYKSARFMAGRIAESMGALGRKLNSLLEAEGVRLVRKRARKGPGGAKKQAAAATRKVSGKGKARSGGIGRRKSARRKGPEKRS